jgi:hypothetical protein
VFADAEEEEEDVRETGGKASAILWTLFMDFLMILFVHC